MFTDAESYHQDTLKASGGYTSGHFPTICPQPALLAQYSHARQVWAV